MNKIQISENKRWEMAARANDDLADALIENKMSKDDKAAFVDCYKKDICKMLWNKARLCRENVVN
ncbi:MAG: hypothetical protein WC444_06690 [Candidatus Paceibacterota bacterium]